MSELFAILNNNMETWFCDESIFNHPKNRRSEPGSQYIGKILSLLFYIN